VVARDGNAWWVAAVYLLFLVEQIPVEQCAQMTFDHNNWNSETLCQCLAEHGWNAKHRSMGDPRASLFGGISCPKML